MFFPFYLIAGNNGEADIIHAYLNDFCATILSWSWFERHLCPVQPSRFNRHRTERDRPPAGSSAENVFAIGDHLNDLPMLPTEHADLLLPRPFRSLKPRSSSRTDSSAVFRKAQECGSP
jgi:hypothetical protein